MSKSSLSTNQELRKGEFLESPNKLYTAIYQDDNNFVIYKKGGQVIWASDTYQIDSYRILLQEDGNLVMYNKADKGVWQTNTHSGANLTRMRLTLSNDGRLLLDNNGVNIWNSTQNRGVKG